MSLGYFLLEEGVDIELKADMKEIIALLDSELPNFFYNGYGYRISSLKGVLGSQWRLLVKPRDRASDAELTPTVGLIEMDKLEGGGVSFSMPPRDQWGDDEARAFDEEGRFFGSFVFQLLNAFQSRGFIDLPGQLPIH